MNSNTNKIIVVYECINNTYNIHYIQ